MLFRFFIILLSVSIGSSATVRFDKVLIERIELTNSSVFTRSHLKELLREYEKRALSFEELEELRRKASQLYVDKGMINSGFILEEAITDGVLRLRAVEGELSQINSNTSKYYDSKFLKKRLMKHASKPFSLLALQRSLQRLRYEPRIQQIKAKFSPGVGRGSGVLDLKIKENKPIRWKLFGSNNKPPSVGEKNYGLSVSHQNLSGKGDTLGVAYSTTSGLEDYQLDYTYPLLSGDQIQLRFSRYSSSLLEAPFDRLNIQSRTSNYSLGYSKYLYWNTTLENKVSLSLQHKSSKSFLMGQPFSLSEGSLDGRSALSALEFRQDWLKRDSRRVIASGWSLNHGLDSFGTTPELNGIEQDFWILRTSLDWMERTKAHPDRMLFMRLHAQLTEDTLPQLFKYSLGGMHTIRGYRENFIMRDNALLSSLEVRFPIKEFVNSKLKEFYVVPFLDWGRGWDANDPDKLVKSAMSVGLGIRTKFNNDLGLQVYYGHALRGQSSGNSLQDKGLHFQFDWLQF